jgi:hypothetical protein
MPEWTNSPGAWTPALVTAGLTGFFRIITIGLVFPKRGAVDRGGGATTPHWRILAAG